jgi:HEAT repeat protein
MNPRSPSVPIPALRALFAVLLALSVTAVVDAQPQADACPPSVRAVPTVPVRAQPDKKEPDKKEPDKKDSPKQPEIKWPTEINGKSLHDILKDMEDPDPHIRQLAARTLPNFGTPAQKDPAVGKMLIKRMKSVNESDPSVRVAVFSAIGTFVSLGSFADDDTKEMVRLLAEIVDTNAPASMTRLTAVQVLATFGHKAESAITKLTGTAITDPAYETRRGIAVTLGHIGSNEKSGPNVLALSKLADVLAKDTSAAVRMEAMQSLMLLGPPWEAVKGTGKEPPVIDTKKAGDVVKAMKIRVGDPGAKPPTHGLEKDKQVEIWARLVIMRFDPVNEINDANIDALAKHLASTDVNVKAQALQALLIVGEEAGKKWKDVVTIMEDKTAPAPLTLGAIQTLMAMSAGGKPALPALKKMLEDKKSEFEKKKGEFEKKLEELKKLEAAKTSLEPKELNEKAAKLFGEAAELEAAAKTLDALVGTLDAAIKHISEAKPMNQPAKNDPPKKDPKKP